jgi:hypothetical protein
MAIKSFTKLVPERHTAKLENLCKMDARWVTFLFITGAVLIIGKC